MLANPYVVLLVLLIVFCAIVWAAQRIIKAFSIQDPIATVIWVGIVLLAIFILVSQVGGIGFHLGGLGRAC
jgi:hypothetical protein